MSTHAPPIVIQYYVIYSGVECLIFPTCRAMREACKILSRVPRRKGRRELLNRFYTQLAEDLD